MNEDVRRAHEILLLLDTLDREVDALQDEADRTPREIEEEVAALAALKEQRAAAAAELEGVEARQREAERALERLEKRKDKAVARLPDLGTLAQIEATQREIAALSAEDGDLETTILEMMDDVETRQAALAAQDALLERSASVLSDHQAGWVAREPILRARVAQLEAERAAPVGELRPDVARRYTLGRSQRAWATRSGITWADAARVCTTCRCGVSARWLQECRDHSAHHACDGCKRMLVPREAPEEPEEAE